METSLHRQLKEMYCGPTARVEVPLGNYRIDVITEDQLVEIQHGSLAAIRDKIGRLVESHRVVVVKPIIVRKKLIKKNHKAGPVIGQRFSPRRGSVLSLFDELVYFTRVFPHQNLMLEVPLVEIEELRFPGHGRRRWRRESDFQVEDRKLVRVDQIHRFRDANDLATLIPAGLPAPFHTGQLADLLGVERWIAQRIAYCLREMGATREVGRMRNARLYKFAASRQ